MYCKSLIQQQIELIEERASFARDINEMLERYYIADGVWGVSNKRTYELSNGYFVPVKEFTSINEAIKEMDQRKQAVRIIEGRCILGDVYQCLADTPDEAQVFSIEFLEDVVK